MKSNDHVFELKGNREYVHGTDIFNHLLKDVARDSVPLSNIELIFSRRIENTACTWYQSRDKGRIHALSAPCRGHYQLGDVVYYVSLAPQETQGARTRIEYDEDAITAGSRLTVSTAVVRTNRNYTFIENLIALNKQFHNTYYTPPVNKWMFAKLELTSAPDDTENIELRVASMIPNRLSKCRIVADKTEIGFLFFAIG